MAACRGETKMADALHTYAKRAETECDQHTPSFLNSSLDGHDYCKKTPTKAKRKRLQSSPTGKSPVQISKQKKEGLDPSHRCQYSWTQDERLGLIEHVKKHGVTSVSQKKFWEDCAAYMNKTFPGKVRTGSSCRSTYKRMGPSFQEDLVIPPDKVCECRSQATHSETSQKETATCETQTEPVLPVTDFCVPDVPDNWKLLGHKISVDSSNIRRGAKDIYSLLYKGSGRPGNLTIEEKQILIDTINLGNIHHLVAILRSIPCIHDMVKKLILQDVEEEARNASSRKHSVLARNKFQDITNFSWDEIVSEMVTQQSFLAQILLSVSFPSGRRGSKKACEALVPVLSTVYGILMKARFPELSAVQHIISVALSNEQAHQKIYDRLQPLGITISHSTLLRIFDTMAGHFNKELINSVKQGKKYRIVGDNINFQVGVRYERKNEKQKHMEHWFGSAAIVQNINFNNIPEIAPQRNITDMAWWEFLPSRDDFNRLIKDYCILVGRILVKFLPAFQPLKDVVKKPVKGEFSDVLKQKNKLIPLPALPKNEQKYSDVIDIMDKYESVVIEVSKKAGVPVDSVQIGGDQLTRERFSGAKRLRACALTDYERFEHLTPITFELFHLQMNFLTVFYQVLYKTSSTENVTLHAQKIRLQRKDADGTDVKNHFNHCKDLAESFISAYIVEAACEFFHLENTDSEFCLDIPCNATEQEKQDLLYSKLRPFILTMILAGTMQKNDILKEDDQTYLIVYPDGRTQTIRVVKKQAEDKQPDFMMRYAHNVLELGLLFLELNDIVSMPDRMRLLSSLKYMMLIFKGHNNRSKYALEILRFLAHQMALFSEKTAYESLYGLFVNTKGKMDSNIPADLQMEYIVKLTKKHLKSMCSNVEEADVIKRSSAFFGMTEIAEQFDNMTGVIKRAHYHKVKQSTSDEMQIVKDLRMSKPFKLTPDREIPSIGKCHFSPIAKLTKEELITWIESHKVLFFYELGK